MTKMTESALRQWGNVQDALDPTYGDRTPIDVLRTEYAHRAMSKIVGDLLDDLVDAYDGDDRKAMMAACTAISAAAAADQRPTMTRR